MTGATYAAPKGVHMTCAALSFALFFLRGWSRFRGGRLHAARWARRRAWWAALAVFVVIGAFAIVKPV